MIYKSGGKKFFPLDCHLPHSFMCAHIQPMCNNIKLISKWNISY